MATCKPRCLAWPLATTLLLAFLLAPSAAVTKVQHKVRCSEEYMTIEVIRPDADSAVYLDNLKDYPDPACRPREAEEGGRLITFQLSLGDVFRCGLTRVHNSITGRSVFYHRVIVERGLRAGSGSVAADEGKQLLSVKCVITQAPGNQTRTRRNVLPAGFQEPEELEITKTFTSMAPEPVLRVAVRQAGRVVSGELNVSPGTALQMELGLDPASAPVYGLLVSHMQVSDTRTQEETIIFNGCSVDPYLFENFNTVDGDFLTAKFRAFKFPESTYVQFKGTVNVCLDKCRGVECSNGQTGYGRRRRAVSELPPDPNKVFEITMSTFLKVDYLGEQLIEKGKLSAILEPFANQTQEVKQELEMQQEVQGKATLQEEVREEDRYTLMMIANTSSAATFQLPTLCIVAALVLRLLML